MQKGECDRCQFGSLIMTDIKDTYIASLLCHRGCYDTSDKSSVTPDLAPSTAHVPKRRACQAGVVGSADVGRAISTQAG